MRRFKMTLAILVSASGAASAQNAPPAATNAGPRPAAATPGNAAPKRIDEISPAEAIQRARGSLMRASLGANPDPAQISFMAVAEPQPRTLKKHDLVTIIVREESQSKSNGSTDLKKEATFETKLEEFIKLSFKNAALEGGGVGTTPPSIKMSGSREFKGDGSVDRSDSLTFRVTGEVIDVKPNGTLVLQARQRIKTDDEEQMFILSGVCRAEDVSPDNTVLSTQMFDKDVTKTTKGAVRDSTKRGWVPKLLDALNPF